MLYFRILLQLVLEFIFGFVYCPLFGIGHFFHIYLFEYGFIMFSIAFHVLNAIFIGVT
jgi:hypothetical protein